MMDCESSQHNHSSSEWDLQTLEILNPDMSLFMQNSPFFASAISSAGSPEDANSILSENEYGKRRRLQLFPQDELRPTMRRGLQECWRFDPSFNCGRQSRDSDATAASEDQLISSLKTAISEATPSTEAATASATDATFQSSSEKKPDFELPIDSPSASSESLRRFRKKAGAKVAYPFAMVKPGGVEGDVTLGDINERLLMRPRRPVRHPVGEFACMPSVSAGGPGLSGKDVVALTRIQTQGNGSITVIRTKG